MGRVKAALIHLGISVGVFFSIVAVAVISWYPPPYFFADGGWQMIRLAASVDVVLGPLLTLIVFKTGKPSLRFDLTMIGILQVSVLIWGVVLMYQQRPLFVALGDGRFYTVTESQLTQDGHFQDKAHFLEQGTPVLVFVRLPENPKEKVALLTAGLRGESTFYTRPELYEPLSRNMPAVLKAGVDITAWVRKRPQDRAALAAFIKRHGGRVEDYVFLPLICRYQSLFLVLHQPEGTVVGTLAVIPPPF